METVNKSNPEVVKDFILESMGDNKALTIDWVVWMLGVLAGAGDAPINPDWLRAMGRFPDDGEPIAMFFDSPQ